MQTLDKFVEKAVIDSWRHPEGRLTFSRPVTDEPPCGDGSMTFSAKWSYSGSYQDEFRAPAGQLDKEDRHEAEDQKTRVTKDWTQMLENYGLQVLHHDDNHKTVARKWFDEEQVAKILNSQGTVVAPADVVARERKRRHDTGTDRRYTFNTQSIFALGSTLDLSDSQILERIKSFYTTN